ncbi:MAG: 16S rRNA (guanine(527)-N(7))-methyltransferase RsmG [Betaproteobacteria bacterium]|nr:16S rRNA (guanine(527)-N(7))-methyltransferase RsmG [Betaproteobacteria bacterium]MDH3436084.1 16S rRNA (guanine(527)-N(7))-methyltransferase RsmG [Betaproteobacteria bacterium]
MNLAAQLAEGVAQLGLSLPPQTQQQLFDYLALLDKWNQVYNLTAVRDPSDMVSQHLLDCLAVAPHVSAVTILDVGSGAGLPGIPLALALPHAQVTLLDSSQKKTAFLRQAVIELGLGNATVECARVETWRAAQPFELVISRALSDLAELVTLAGQHMAAGGTLAAMKGVYPHEELAHLPHDLGFRLRRAQALSVPGLRAARHLLLLERT